LLAVLVVGCTPLAPGALTADTLPAQHVEINLIQKVPSETTTYTDGHQERDWLAPTMTALGPELGVRYGASSLLEIGARGSLGSFYALGAEVDAKVGSAVGPLSAAVDVAAQGYPFARSGGVQTSGILTLHLGPALALNASGLVGVGVVTPGEPCACDTSGEFPADRLGDPSPAQTWGVAGGLQFTLGKEVTLMPEVSWQRIQIIHPVDFDHIDVIGFNVVLGFRRTQPGF
jgi:hypothetical protein